jgi:catechol 2,3-dioxygenase-like lactoylglutathione lyase family enzyme
MKRFHVNLSVNDLSESIRFYTALFAMAQRGRASGVNHLGFQVDSAEELTAMRAQLRRADHALV